MKSKKRSRTLIVLGALILVYIIFKLILLILAASSMDDPFAQLSKNVFELDVTDIKYISVQNGTTGEEYQFSGDELEEAAAKLNDLHWKYVYGRLPVETGGWSYRIIIEDNGGNWSSYLIGDNYLVVDDVVFRTSSGEFKEFIDHVS